MAGLVARTGPVTYRPGRADDLDACTLIWKAAIEDYQARLAQPPMADDLAPLRRLLAHTLATDPDRFWVAVDGDGEVAGFSSATLREGLWFLAMLFVRPGVQAAGVGQALMDRAQAGRDVDPGGPAVPGPDEPLDTGIHTWGMCTDAAQPISNALYARRGMVPRIPAWRLVGEVRRWSARAAAPRVARGGAVRGAGRRRARRPSAPGGGRRRARPRADRGRASRRSRVPAARGPVRVPRPRAGDRAGPRVRVRVRGRAPGAGGGARPRAAPRAASGVAVRETPMLGTVAMWVPGTADRATRALLDAGLRFDGFPGLICWSRPDHPFERYVPISLALV